MKDFFSKTWVKILAFVLVAIGAAALIIGGFTTAEIGTVVEAVAGVLTAIGALISLIASLVNKK